MTPTRNWGVNFYQVLLEKFESVYRPGKQVCVDEAIIAFRGKVHFRVFIKNKPDKYGVKAFKMCDSKNGYCCKIEMYTGKREEEPSEKGATCDLVVRLVEDLAASGRIVFMDNYFSSPVLYHTLLDMGLRATGTARNRKGLPAEIKNLKLKPTEKMEMTDGTLNVVKIHDRRQVMLLSSIHSMVGKNSRRRDREGIPIEKPQMIEEYNRYMGGVDTNDQRNKAHVEVVEESLFLLVLYCHAQWPHRVRRVVSGKWKEGHDTEEI